MYAVTIDDVDERNCLAFDLKDILALAGERAANSTWRLSNVEAGGETAAQELHRLSDEQVAVSGERLLELANEVWQVIEGNFEGFDGIRGPLWLTIRAVDSSCFDVITEDADLIRRIRSTFRQVTDLPKDAH